MKKIILISILTAGYAMATNFSHMSNEQLQNMRGKVSDSQRGAFRAEMQKRNINGTGKGKGMEHGGKGKNQLGKGQGMGNGKGMGNGNGMKNGGKENKKKLY